MKWKLMRFKRFLNILKKKNHFSFPSGNCQNWGGKGLFIFFPQDPFEIFCCCEFALKSPQRVCSQMFSHTPFGTDPREFSHPPSPWSLPWHRLMQGVNPISWTGPLSVVRAFYSPSCLVVVGCACVVGRAVEAAVAPGSTHADVVHRPSSGPEGLYICSCRYTFFPCLLFGFTSFTKPQGWASCISFNWGHIYLLSVQWFFPVSSCESS